VGDGEGRVNRRTLLIGLAAVPVAAALPEPEPVFHAGGVVPPGGPPPNLPTVGNPAQSRVYPARDATLTISDGSGTYTVALGAETLWRSAAGLSTMRPIAGRIGDDP
jgi:hypothetical protein